MNERRRSPRRGRGPRPQGRGADPLADEPNPYADESPAGDAAVSVENDAPAAPRAEEAPAAERVERPARPERPERGQRPDRGPRSDRTDRGDRVDRGDRGSPADADGRGARRRGQGRRGRGRNGKREQPVGAERAPAQPVAATGETAGWFDTGRDGGFVRLAENSYLPDSTDAFLPTHLIRQLGLRRGDLVQATTGRDHRGRTVVVEVQTINGTAAAEVGKRPDFQSLTASYPERKLFLETGRPAKGGPELTRRAVDLIAPIGYGQRALIVAPARAGKTTLLQAIVEGVAINHPDSHLFVLLVDERPEEVSEMVTWGYGEVVASSFDMPAERHTHVAEMVLERARRLVELGEHVVIVLDSITRLARAHNTVDRGTGRTMSGGLDATAMAKPKAFFGSARAVMDGGSLSIIATALVETGSRMDDVIFEEFKGTGNCEIKLDRSLAEKRLFPAIDIGTSGTRREEKLFRPDQVEAVHTLRRGLGQMPPQSALEWLIKRIAATANNDGLLMGL